ncbi:MAG: hypothetical protein H0X63_05240 [Flavobacteriales bacterium]|nr:hypothetical protein [Flavobacteriales bacterium]
MKIKPLIINALSFAGYTWRTWWSCYLSKLLMALNLGIKTNNAAYAQAIENINS